MQNCDLIVKGKYVLPMDDEMSIIKDGMVVVEKNKIIAVGYVFFSGNHGQSC